MRLRFRWQRDPEDDDEPVATRNPRDGFCDQCGLGADQGDHNPCERRRQLEPPRFCRDCGRRMVVHVTPTGWTGRCRRHGERSSDDSD